MGKTVYFTASTVNGFLASDDHDLSWLLTRDIDQGGPGGGSPRPTSRTGWLGAAVERYRVLLLDQRGTGRSTPLIPERAATSSIVAA